MYFKKYCQIKINIVESKKFYPITLKYIDLDQPHTLQNLMVCGHQYNATSYI